MNLKPCESSNLSRKSAEASPPLEIKQEKTPLVQTLILNSTGADVTCNKEIKIQY